MIRLQMSAIYKLVDQMRWNKHQLKDYKKSISTKQSKQKSKEDEKSIKSWGN